MRLVEDDAVPLACKQATAALRHFREKDSIRCNHDIERGKVRGGLVPVYGWGGGGNRSES